MVDAVINGHVRERWETFSPARDNAMARLEATMVSLCRGPFPERLGLILEEHLATGGKRVRARLALAAAEAFGINDRAAMPWAASCELLHNATLIHDDVQDGDSVRRGRPTTWARHGMPQAINAGDLMLMLPFLGVDELDCDAAIKWSLAKLTAERAADVVRGQSLEMQLLPEGRFDRTTYDRMVLGKTGALMSLPVEGAALLAGADPNTARRVGEPFAQLGVLFQLQDDVLDLYGDKGRCQPGNDLREGKVSALVVEHLERRPGDREELAALLGRPRESTSEDEVARWIERFTASGSLRAAIARIDWIADSARNTPALAQLPALRAVADFLIQITLEPIAHVRGSSLVKGHRP